MPRLSVQEASGGRAKALAARPVAACRSCMSARSDAACMRRRPVRHPCVRACRDVSLGVALSGPCFGQRSERVPAAAVDGRALRDHSGANVSRLSSWDVTRHARDEWGAKEPRGVGVTFGLATRKLHPKVARRQVSLSDPQSSPPRPDRAAGAGGSACPAPQHAIQVVPGVGHRKWARALQRRSDQHQEQGSAGLSPCEVASGLRPSSGLDRRRSARPGPAALHVTAGPESAKHYQ